MQHQITPKTNENCEAEKCRAAGNSMKSVLSTQTLILITGRS